MTIQELEKAALEIRINLLKLCNKEAIHIGGDLSGADVMTVLWQYQMNYDPKNINDENRDRFVLSKGHASAVTSFNQAAIGCFTAENVIAEYATDGGRFSMHSCNLINPYVEISTGSLGHGMP
nr:transketolase [Lachnospiraceae bacterium]